jgi:hypothetical protein
MGIGFHASARWFSRCAAIVSLTAVPVGTFAQAPPRSHAAYGPGYSSGPQMMSSPDCGGSCSECYADPYGGSGPYGGNPNCDAMPMRGGFTGPFPMGAGGTDPAIGYDLMNDVGVEGFLVDQRGPHYFDFRAEAVYLERDETFERDIDFTSRDIGPPGGGGPIVLSSRDLDYDKEVGFRVIGRYDIDPLAVFEFGYMGIYEFNDRVTATSDQNELFSLFSTFGNLPPAGQAPPNVGLLNGPMRATERGSEHSIAIEHTLQTGELSYRRYWLGHSPRISGTILAGFRYTKLDEGFQFNTTGSTLEPLGGPPATLDYFLDADNNLAGFQTGGDVWIGLMQGLRLGAEGKAGIYNNHYTVETQINTFPGTAATVPVTPGAALAERFKDDQASFIGEASVDLVADILPSWSLRAGYEVLFISSIALAGDNFNTGSPFNTGPVDNGFGPPRRPFVDDQGSVFYHGGHVGVEYIW